MKGGRPKGSKNSILKQRRGDAPVMTATETCDYLRIHRSTLYRLIQGGQIPFFLIGSDYRFNREAIDEWMKDKSSPVH
jgi:excisionase family DNA binding protein